MLPIWLVAIAPCDKAAILSCHYAGDFKPKSHGAQFDYIALQDYVKKTGAEEEIAEQIRRVTDMYRNAISDCSELNNLQKNEQRRPRFLGN